MSTSLVGLGLGRSLTIFTSAARTASVDGTDQNGEDFDFLDLIIDCTAITATPSVVFTIQGKDRVSGKYYTILASAAIVATGTTVLRVGPGITAAVNVAANAMLPSIWRVIAVAGDADSMTYSVGANKG